MSTQHFIPEVRGAFPNGETSKCFVMRFDAHGNPIFTSSSMWDAQEQLPSPTRVASSHAHAHEGWMQRESNFGLGHNNRFPNFLTQAPDASCYWQPLPRHHELRDEQTSNVYAGGMEQLQQQKQKQPRRAKELNALSSSFEIKTNAVEQYSALPAAAADNTAV